MPHLVQVVLGDQLVARKSRKGHGLKLPFSSILLREKMRAQICKRRFNKWNFQWEYLVLLGLTSLSQARGVWVQCRLVCPLAASEECVGSVGILLCAFPVLLSVELLDSKHSSWPSLELSASLCAFPLLCTFYLDNERTEGKTVFLYVTSTAASHVNISFPPVHSDFVYFFKHFGFFWGDSSSRANQFAQCAQLRVALNRSHLLCLPADRVFWKYLACNVTLPGLLFLLQTCN